MTHDEITQAIRKSLLMEDSCAARHGVYAKRKPVVEYHKPAEIDDREHSDLSDEGWVE